MKYFKKTTTLIIATVIIFTGKTTLDSKTLGGEVKAITDQAEQAQQSRKTALNTHIPTEAPTPEPKPEPEPRARIYDIPLSQELQEYTFYLCEESGLDYETVLAIMDQESDYREKVISKTNDYGIMQINKANQGWLKEELGIEDFLDAEQNIRAGIRILSELTGKYEDQHQVLMAYNCGEAGAKRLWNQGKTTSTYSRSVMTTAEKLREENENGNHMREMQPTTKGSEEHRARVRPGLLEGSQGSSGQRGRNQ